MQLRRLGRTDLSIAPLVLGGNVFGWTADKKASFAVLDAFAGAGLNAIDTADAYSTWVPGNEGGESETIIGEWMKARGNRARVIVITKVGSPMGQGKEGLKARYIEEAVEASLKRLQTDAIDLYLSHWPDVATPYDETLGAYQRLIEKGKIPGAAPRTSMSRCSRGRSGRQKRAAARATKSCSRNTTSPTVANSRMASPTSARARRSASFPISASPRAFCRANTAARRTSPRARAEAGSRPISIRAGFSFSTRSTRSPPSTRPSRPRPRSPGLWRGRASPPRSPAPPPLSRSKPRPCDRAQADASRHG